MVNENNYAEDKVLVIDRGYRKSLCINCGKDISDDIVRETCNICRPDESLNYYKPYRIPTNEHVNLLTTNQDKNMIINIKRTHENAVIPTKANNDDGNACYDVTATSMTIAEDYSYVEYGLGFSLEFPKEWEVLIRPRSSVSKYDLIMCNAPGTIDSNYRGEVRVRFKIVPNLKVLENYFKLKKTDVSIENMLKDLKLYQVGDKVAQITPKLVTNIRFVESDLTQTNRADGGFGSTGN